jgi:hypothetical protein
MEIKKVHSTSSETTGAVQMLPHYRAYQRLDNSSVLGCNHKLAGFQNFHTSFPTTSHARNADIEILIPSYFSKTSKYASLVSASLKNLTNSAAVSSVIKVGLNISEKDLRIDFSLLNSV